MCDGCEGTRSSALALLNTTTHDLRNLPSSKARVVSMGSSCLYAGVMPQRRWGDGGRRPAVEHQQRKAGAQEGVRGNRGAAPLQGGEVFERGFVLCF
jgi:hypothetical protein